MKVVAISFFLASICLIVFAQKADSLEVLLSNAKSDSTKTILASLLADELAGSNPRKAVDVARQGLTLAQDIGFEKGIFENYFSLAAAHQSQALFDSALFYYRKANRIAEKREDIKGLAEICSGLGHSFMRKSEMDSARHYLEKGLALAKSAKNYKIEAGIYNNYGNVFLEESNYQKALDYFVRAARLYENPLADDQGQCLALSNIGNIEYRLGNLEKALDYGRQSMAIAKERKLTSSIGYAHKLLGRIHKKQEKLDSALIEYEQGQKIYAALGDTRSAAELLQNIGNVYFDKGKYRDALANYQQSLKLAKSLPSKPLVAYAYSCIGQAFVVLQENDKALFYLDSSRLVAKALGNMYLVMDNYMAMSSVYEAKGNYKKALAIHQQLEQLKDSVTKSENRKLAEETQVKYELEKKEAKIAILEKDQELKSIALGRQRAIQTGSAIVLVLIVVITLLLVNHYRLGNRARRQAEIEQMRNTIARDLHDDIGSTLSSINIMSQLALKEGTGNSAKKIQQINEQSSRVLESMSDIVWSINPENDSLEKVLIKIKEFSAEILEPRNIQFKFNHNGVPSVVLDAEKRKNLFLIFKEAVNNAAKYSGCTNVELTFTHQGKTIQLDLADDGKGFDREHVNQGNGLRNMEERAKSLKGDMVIKSGPEIGTTIRLIMPIT